MNDKIISIMEYYYGSLSSVRTLDGFCLLENSRNFRTTVDSGFLERIRLNPSYDEEYGWVSVKLSEEELEYFEKSNLTELIKEYVSEFGCELVNLDLFRRFYI